MAEITHNSITQAGDYNLKTVELISYRRHAGESQPYRMDIKGITINVELTEDIFTNVMVGAITVYDTQDVRSVLPITGLEKLNLQFSTPGMVGVKAVEEDGYPFSVYKISEVRVDANNPRGQLYKIYFTSQEMYFSSLNRISKAYTGPIEDAVEDILRNKNYLNSKKPFYFEPSRNNSKFVIPNLRPLNAINFLSKFGLSASYKNSGYLFYETPDGYHFRTIESLLGIGGAKARPAKFKYQYQVANIRTGETRDVADDMRNVIKYDFVRPVDILRQIREGAYATKLIRHDAFNKTFITTNYDYADSFGDYFHTEHDNGDKATDKFVVPYANYEDTNKDISQNYMSKLMTSTQTSKIHNDYEYPLNNETRQQHHSQRIQLQNANLKLLVFGNSLVKAGDIITFDLPLMRPVGDNNRQESNPYYAGRYLVASIKHIINISAARYEMILDCTKDAVRTPYAVELENNTINTPEGTVNSVYDTDADILSGDILEST